MPQINPSNEPEISIANLAKDQGVIFAGPITAADIRITQSANVPISELLVLAGSDGYDKNLFVEPVNFDEAATKLLSHRLLWISGPPGAGKSWLARHLIKTVLSAAEFFRPRNWQDLAAIAEANEVSGAVIILPNAAYLAQASEEVEPEADEMEAEEGEIEELEAEPAEPAGEVEIELAALATTASLETSEPVEAGEDAESETAAAPLTESEILEDLEDVAEAKSEGVAGYLRRLIDHQNTIIITSSEEVFMRVRSDLELILPHHPEKFVARLDASSYGLTERLRLLWSSINQVCEYKTIGDEASGWAKESHKQLEESDLTKNESPVFKDWLPGEIYDFVCSILLWANDPEAVKDAFNLPLYERARGLVRDFNLSDKCFLMTLALSPEAKEAAREGTYPMANRMKEITAALKKDHYDVSQQAIVDYRQKAAPYVLEFQFVNQRVAEVVTEEIARLCPDIFAALIPLFRRWSAPEDLSMVEETAPIRAAIARMAGKVGRYDLEYTRDLLEFWASQRSSRVGQSAGAALREASCGGAQSDKAVKKLIREWLKASGTTTDDYRRRSATDAIWQVATVEPHEEKCAWALESLKRLVKDRSPYVRESAARALVKLAQTYSLARVETLLTELADTAEMSGKGREKVRLDIARQLADAPISREEVTLLLESWVATGQTALLRIAVCYLLLNGNLIERDRLLLRRILREYPRDFASAVNLMLGRTLQWQHWKPFWSRILNDLARDAEPLANQQAALALYRLREKAILLGLPRVDKYAAGMLASWETTPNIASETTALVYRFLRCIADGRSAFIKERLEPLAANKSGERRAQAALWLHLLRTGLLWTNRLNSRAQRIFNRLLENWLASGDENTCATAILYCLIAPNFGDDRKCKLLAQILRCFHPKAEVVMQEALRTMPLAQLSFTLKQLASRNSALVRKQVAAAAASITSESEQALDNLIMSFLEPDDAEEYANPKACVTVTFYWILATARPEESRCRAITQVLHSFPSEFHRAMREGAEVLGTDNLLPVITQLAENPSNFIRQHAARALDEVAGAVPWTVRELLTIWAFSTDANLRETGLYCCFIAQALKFEDRRTNLIESLRVSPRFFFSTLQQAWNDLLHAGQTRLTTAALGRQEESRALLAGKLMEVHQTDPELADDLLERFRVSELSEVREIHAAFCRWQFRRKNEKS